MKSTVVNNQVNIILRVDNCAVQLFYVDLIGILWNAVFSVRAFKY